MASGVTVLVTLNRLVTVGSLLYAYWNLSNISRNDPRVTEAILKRHPFGAILFFTNWNAVFQIIFFLSCLCKQFTSSVKFDSRKTTKRGLFFHGVIFPCSVLVCVFFWSFFMTYRDMVIPADSEVFLTPLVNHILHTQIVIGMLIEGFLVEHPRPKTKDGLLVLFTIFGFYNLCVFYLGTAYGAWVYPILGVMSGGARVAFGLVMVLVNYGLYRLGGLYYSILWGDTEVKARPKSK
ncbi:Androgen-induced -like protein [Halotydeus destructor]|nr:Androgen-induced -like protein [Halotydeus destructor]